MKFSPLSFLLFIAISTPSLFSQAQNPQQPARKNFDKMKTGEKNNPEARLSGSDSGEFKFFTEQFADFRILRYQVPGFQQLSLRQKKLCYYLSEAALAGRDIFYDQNYKHNLAVRKTLEAIIASKQTDRSGEDWKKFEIYTKRVWFSSGIHHVYSNNKMLPECSQQWFAAQIRNCNPKSLPLQPDQNVDQFISFITPVIFDSAVAPKRVNMDAKEDLVKTSAVNFYENISQEEVTNYYKSLSRKNEESPPSYGLNSKLMKENGKIVEKTWKVGGMYSPAIEKIVSWLQKAETVAENDHQKKAIQHLIAYYQTGDLRKFDEYNLEWIQDTTSVVDFVNGFIEVYHDPLGYKGSWEAYVSIKDSIATIRIKTIGDQAQWFEDHSPIMDQHKKKNVKGISARVINVVFEAGDLAPLTAIGINLPNSDWIRKIGSKSVTIDNISYAYKEDAKSSGVMEEFYYNDEIKNRMKQYGSLSENLHTDMHEVIGHASGQLNPGVGSLNETLKNYANTLEEARADLVALYYILDPKLVEIGVMPSIDVGKAAYDRYIQNGLMIQLTRLPSTENQLEQSHMRNRQMIAAWAYKHGEEKVISKVVRDGKTFFVINDYNKLRTLFGQLLREVQRIKSEGDYAAGSALVETYGVKVDPQLHKEILDRYTKLNIAPYRGFIQPHLTPVSDQNGEITDVKIIYPQKFQLQMMNFGRKYSFLPAVN